MIIRCGFRMAVSRGLHLAQKLADLDEVRYVALSTGAYDLILACLFRSDEELLDFLTIKLAAIHGIKKVATSHVLRVFKRTYDWVTSGLDAPRPS